jgi:hypothetical protein
MAFGFGAPRAGVYARDRYMHGLRRWRARTRKIRAMCFGPFMAAGLGGLLVFGHPRAWVAGVMFGIGAGAVIAVRESPPEYIEKWQRGAAGERKTEKALRALDPEEWLVLHDVPSARGNYDHIVVGRAGVFVLDSKNLLGKVHMSGSEPYLCRRLDPEADEPCGWIRNGALGGAAHLYRALKQRTSHASWVQAVVVLWADFDEGIYEDQRCVVVHGGRLCDWIASRPAALDRPTTNELVEAVQAIATEASPHELARPKRLAGEPIWRRR